MNKAIIQWKAAMAQMRDANLIAAEIDPTKGTFTQRAARNIAERHLDRYFELVEAELNHHWKLCGEQQWPPLTSMASMRHSAASTFMTAAPDTATHEWHCCAGS